MKRSTACFLSVLLTLSLLVQPFLALSFIKSYTLPSLANNPLGLVVDEFSGEVFISSATAELRLLRFNSNLCLLRNALVDTANPRITMVGDFGINTNMNPAMLVPIYFYFPFGDSQSTFKIAYRNATLNPLEGNDCFNAVSINIFPLNARLVVNQVTGKVYYSTNEVLNVLPSTQPGDCAPPLSVTQSNVINAMASDDNLNLLFLGMGSTIYVMDQTTLSILTSIVVAQPPTQMEANSVTKQLHVIAGSQLYLVIDYSNLAALNIVATQAFEFLTLTNLALDLALNRAYLLATMTFPAQAQVIVQFENNIYQSVSLLANVGAAELIAFNPNNQCIYLTGNDLENSSAPSIFKFC